MAKKKTQGAVLATMVCLALSSGTALAATPASTGERLLDAAENNAHIQAKAVPPLRWDAALQGRQSKAQPVIITAKDVAAQKAQTGFKAPQAPSQAPPAQVQVAPPAQVQAAPAQVQAAPAQAKAVPAAPAAQTQKAQETAKTIPFQALFRDPVLSAAKQQAQAAPVAPAKVQQQAQAAPVAPAKVQQQAQGQPQVKPQAKAEPPKVTTLPAQPPKQVAPPVHQTSQGDRRPAAFRDVSDSAWRHIQAGIFATVEQLRSAGPQNLESAALHLVQLLNANDKLTRMEKVEYLIGIGYAINHSNLRPYQKGALIKLISVNFA